MPGDTESHTETTPELILGIDYEAVIANATYPECLHYYDALNTHYKTLDESSDKERAAIRFLALIVSYYPNFDRPGNPFGPMMVMAGRSSGEAEDLSDSELDTLQEIIPETLDPELRARFADILWECRRLHEMARIAVEAYQFSAKRLKSLDQPNFVDRFRRALQLSAKLGRRKELHLAVIAQVASEALEVGSGHFGMLELLTEHQPENADRFSKWTFDQAKNAESDAFWGDAQQYWKIHRTFALMASDAERAEAAVLSAARCLFKQAQTEAEFGPGNNMGAALTMSRAYEALRQARAPQTEVDVAHAELRRLQRRTVSEMHTFDLRWSDVPGGDELRIKSQERATRMVSGRSFPEALLLLCAVSNPTDSKSVVDRIKNESGLAAMFDNYHFTETGLVNQITPGAIRSDEQTLRLRAFEMACMIDIPLKVRASIETARCKIVDEHPIRIRDLGFLVSNNFFVPPNREFLYARGIQAGFHGDWIAAAHILIPQLENSIRYLYSRNGIATEWQDSNGEQREQELGWLLTHDKAEELLENDIVFDLRTLLIEKSGTNLRNEMCHGLVSAGAFYDDSVQYLWWLVVRLLCTAHCQGLPNEECLD